MINRIKNSIEELSPTPTKPITSDSGISLVGPGEADDTIVDTASPETDEVAVNTTSTTENITQNPHKAELFEKIDNLEIRERDYEIALKLIEKADPKLLVKIIEEICNGELSFRDFDQYLSDTRYEEILRRDIINQKNLEKYLKNIVSIHNLLNFSEYDSTRYILSKENASEKNIDALTNLYESLYSSNRNDFILSLLKETADDTVLTLAFKRKLLAGITNYRVIDGLDETTKESLDLGDILQINPANLLMSPKDYRIPLTYENQTLSDVDYNFMEIHSLSEGDMKKIKALTLFYKRGAI